MTTQYNVVTYGNLTNTNGVLSGFSSDNYATIPLNFNPTQRPYEVVFKFVGTNGVIWNAGDLTTARGHIEFEVYQNKLYAEFAANTTLIWAIEGVTTLSSNTDYWVKLAYNGVDTYSLYLSTDGTTWNTEGTATSNAFLADGSTQYNLIGCQTDNGAITYSFDGSIDLNESYINIDNIRWWQGATTISNVRTRIQLRHDTAANWTSVNPVLLEGEVGIETDTRKQKFGDGTTAWNSLAYDLGSTALQSITSSDVTTALGYIPVNKAGDTMTGNLNFTTASSNPNIRQITTLSDATLGTLPSVNYYNGFQTKDSQGNEFANVNCSYGTSGRIGSNFYVTRSDSGSTVSGSMGVYIDQGGTEAYAVINCPTTINNGLLSVSSSEITVSNLIHAKTEVATSKGTIPSADCFQGILFEDSDSSHTTWQSNRFGSCQMRLTSTGDTEVSLYAYRNVANSSSGAAQLRLVAPQTGDVYCTVPAPPSSSNGTNAATTAWVRTKINEAFSYNSSTGTLTLGL